MIVELDAASVTAAMRGLPRIGWHVLGAAPLGEGRPQSEHE